MGVTLKQPNAAVEQGMKRPVDLQEWAKCNHSLCNAQEVIHSRSPIRWHEAYIFCEIGR